MGDIVYEDDFGDPIFPSFFEHEIVSIDIDERVIRTIDYSQRGKGAILRSFHTVGELKKRGINFEKV